jgi:hypothetical protein
MSTTSASRATPSSSAASNDTGNDDATSGRSIKVATPDYFYGERNKLEEWLLQFDLYFTFQGSEVKDDQQVTLVATYMRGAALAWIKPAIIKYMAGEAPADVETWMEDFDEFKKKIRVVFGSKSDVNIAIRNIQTLKQTRSVADYANQFQQYSLLTEWDDKALMTMFRQGLKNDVKIELMRSGASLETLNDVIDEAIDIDTRLYELSLELRPNSRVQQDNPKGRSQNNNRQYRTNNHANRSAPRVTHLTHDTYGAEPMVLDNLNKGRSNHRTRGGRGGYQGNNSQRDNKRPESDRTCYNCGKTGHIARNCRSKNNNNKVVRQVNVLTRETQDEDTDEWDIITNDVGQLMLDSDSDDAPKRKRIARSPTPYHAPMTPPESPEQSKKAINVREAFRHAPQDTSELQRILQERQHETAVTNRIMEAYRDRQRGTPTTYPEGQTATQFYEAMDKAVAAETRQAQKLRKEQEEERRVTANLETFRERMNVLNQTQPSFAPTLAEERYLQALAAQSDTEVDSDGSPEEYRTPPEEDPKDSNEEALANYQKGIREWNKTRRTQKEATRATIKTLPKYYLDARNPLHARMSWTTCYHKYCPVHYSDKQGTNWEPVAPYVCSKPWWECHDDICAEHLWDKRQAAHFPGKHDNPQEAVRMNLIISGTCSLSKWHRCLNPDCRTHWEAKKANGFGDDTFLGQRLAPGITPEKLIPSGTTPSSSSQ